ncbi:MAG: hypothetical protein ACYTEX_23470, partial [Planctomycetota bacterium]
FVHLHEKDPFANLSSETLQKTMLSPSPSEYAYLFINHPAAPAAVLLCGQSLEPQAKTHSLRLAKHPP